MELPSWKKVKWWKYVFIPVLLLLPWIYRFYWNVSPLKLPPHKGATRVPELPGRAKHPAGSTVLRGEPASLVRVRGTKTLLISAYLEHQTNKKKVRVISIALRSEKAAFRCHLLCRGKLLISDGAIDFHKDHFGFPYGTADIMCPLPPGCETPTNISLTSAGSKPEELDQLGPGFLEIQNQKSVTDSFRYNFTVCFSAMYNFTNVLQLVQSLEMLQLLGVNRVVLYKTNCSADTQRVLDSYTEKGLVEVIPWSLSKYLNVSRRAFPNKSPGDLHYFGQIAALNDFLYRYRYRSRYVALHDVDELILPQSVDRWLELLPLLEKTLGADKCYQFENHWFPVEFELPPPKSQTLPRQDQWKNISGVNILTHLYREPPPTKPTFNNFKIIVNPRAVSRVTVHGALNSVKGCVWVDRNVAHMYHVRNTLCVSLQIPSSSQP
ncbi:uncharacterized protein [Nothobranchius furzeri]|uniref:uncharacterized protein isoform X2 n=1 Tax=Nothobranchius furzeri TaxID=105023 RepID=UPI002403FAC3|nr:uncharacterized protein LOC107379845 isoform X2 [Nothobranchius furzeri]